MLHAAAASAKKIKLTVIDPARQQANLKHRLGAMAVRDINLACSRTASYFLTTPLFRAAWRSYSYLALKTFSGHVRFFSFLLI
jgi:hypothetical protein